MSFEVSGLREEIVWNANNYSRRRTVRSWPWSALSGRNFEYSRSPVLSDHIHFLLRLNKTHLRSLLRGQLKDRVIISADDYFERFGPRASGKHIQRKQNPKRTNGLDERARKQTDTSRASTTARAQAFLNSAFTTQLDRSPRKSPIH